MIYRPQFRPHYHVESVADEAVFALTETDRFVIEGPHLTKIAALIDGKNSVEQIVRQLSATVEPAVVLSGINYLYREGHITESSNALPLELAAFWGLLNTETCIAPSLLNRFPIQVLGNDSSDVMEFIQIASTVGLHICEENPRLRVVVTDDHLATDLKLVNDQCLSDKTPWLLVKSTGIFSWLGPLFIPGNTACWDCLAERLRSNREVDSYIQKRLGRTEPFKVSKAKLKILRQQSLSSCILQILRIIATGDTSQLGSTIIVQDVLNLTNTRHFVTRRPQCKSCGDQHLLRNLEQKFQFQSTPSISFDTAQTGERSVTPEKILMQYGHHVSSITGIVSQLLPAFYHNVGPMRSYVAGHNFALKNDSLYFLKDGLRTSSSGKGKTDEQARASALCEALERYSGVFTGDEAIVNSSFSALGDSALHPNDCMLFSDKQYLDRENWNNRQSRFQVVPLRFDESSSIDWSPVFSYTEGREKYLPTAYLYYGYPSQEERFYCWADSNGNAAGSNFEEAFLQGVLELVERDSVALWWYNRVKRPRVDLNLLKDPFIAEVSDFQERHGREFWVLDLTSDLGIPVFASVTRRKNAQTEDILFGFGAHLDSRIAITRAITEMNQFLPAVLNVDSNGNTRYLMNDQEAIHWWQNARIDDAPYLVPNGTTKLNTSNSNQRIDEQALSVIDILHRKGLEILILNQTKPDVGLVVVKVIVPGLRHFWARLAPGRLYDVPVDLGWIEQKLSEDQLNPIPMFL